MPLFGVDVSHYQANFDFNAARAAGCEFAILKAGEGTGTDNRFLRHLGAARAAGLLVAAYWYQRSSVSAAAQAAAILNTVPADVPVIMDVEANSGDVNLTRDIVNRVRGAGRRVPFTYIPRWYWQQIGSPNLAGLPPLWSSRYPDNVVRAVQDAYNHAPASYWTGYGGNTVGLLQFSSSGNVGGQSPIDLDAFNGSRSQLAAIFGGSASAPTTNAGNAPVRPTHDDEESIMLAPAATDDFITVPCPGKTGLALSLYIYTGYGRRVDIKELVCVKATPSGSGGAYAPSPFPKGLTVDADRPGPIGLPEGTVGVTIRYAADHPFTAYVG